MTKPTIYIDGDNRRIYEVPADSSFTVDANGYRIYTPNSLIGRTDEFVKLSFQIDVWSVFQDWHKQNSWSTVALLRTGGAPTEVIDGVQQYATNNYEIKTSIGWKFVIADYPHVLDIFGNSRANEFGVSYFDSTRIISPGVLGTITLADSLQVVELSASSGLTPEQQALLEQAADCSGGSCEEIQEVFLEHLDSSHDLSIVKDLELSLDSNELNISIDGVSLTFTNENNYELTICQ